MSQPWASLTDGHATGGGPVTAAPRAPAPRQWETHPSWGGRSFESAETNRLNQAHWQRADDQGVNVWLATQLSIVRSRCHYEARQNSTILGCINTYAEDVVGPNGPTLQVISDDDAYNDALERGWRKWFRAPTHRPNVSGAAWLKLRIRSLFKSGEFLDQLITDPNAEGPVTLRVRPTHPRRLITPADMAGNPNVFMGIEFDRIGRPTRYYVHNPIADVRGGLDRVNDYETIPPDLIIHEFILEEEDQARGIPWHNTALVPSSDLRDYDDQVQDAARQMADQCGYFYTDDAGNGAWPLPEIDTVERRTYKMAPPGWKPFVHPATQPPVQYPDYRAERQQEVGRANGMPLLITRLDSSKHNYSSARLDTQGYGRTVEGTQEWISGSEQNCGLLNRLVDEVAKELRFSEPALRNRPEVVTYKWGWPGRPHVDPAKEAAGEDKRLRNRSTSLSEILAAGPGGKSVEVLIETLVRERDLFKKAGLPVPEWLEKPPEPQPAAKTNVTGSQKPAGATK